MLSFLAGSNKRYVDTRVDPAYLERLQKAMDEEHSPKKYYKYKAWLHYANLKSWQEQGWHFAYLNYMGKELHCTCGLAIQIESSTRSDIKSEVLSKLKGLQLDPVQIQTGHKTLPAMSAQTNCLLVNFKWIEHGNNYVWDGICQLCGECRVEMNDLAASKFLTTHENVCSRN